MPRLGEVTTEPIDEHSNRCNLPHRHSAFVGPDRSADQEQSMQAASPSDRKFSGTRSPVCVKRRMLTACTGSQLWFMQFVTSLHGLVLIPVRQQQPIISEHKAADEPICLRNTGSEGFTASENPESGGTRFTCIAFFSSAPQARTPALRLYANIGGSLCD